MVIKELSTISKKILIGFKNMQLKAKNISLAYLSSLIISSSSRNKYTTYDKFPMITRRRKCA